MLKYLTKSQKKLLKRIILSIVLFLIIIIVDKSIHLNSLFNYSWLISLGLYLIVYIIIGYDVIYDAIRKIIHGELLDESFLMVIATFGAFALGIYRALNNQEIEGFDEGCAVLLLYQIGEFFQKYAVNKSRKSIASLMDIRPDYANLKDKGQVDPSDVKVGDIVIVYPGEKIPVDGVITKGQTNLDMKSLTGESKLVEKGINDEVLSGAINIDNEIEIETKKEYYASTASKILDLVENASSQKSKSENFISKFARIYTPLVCLSSLLLFILGSIITKNVDTWLYRSLNFLVVSCPCSLVISVPLTFFASIGVQSKLNILIKGSNFVEKMAKANTFVFDKTGTLTKGNFKITKIYPKENEEKILYYAAICECNSHHPIALSITNYYKENYSKPLINYQINNLAGYGIKAKKEDNVILCGSSKLMELNGIKFDDVNSNHTVIHVSNNNNYIGYIIIEDEIKDEAYSLIDYLNKNNYKSIMLTGDNHLVAREVSKKLNITTFKSQMLPDEKLEEVCNLIENKNENDVVCFIGDGINDAPVLVRSDIGISMGQMGADAAIESSDIVIMNDNLLNIIKCKQISAQTIKIVKQNIILSILVKVLIMILSSFGLASMYLAIFGDVGVCIICILNALRIFNISKKNRD